VSQVLSEKIEIPPWQRIAALVGSDSPLAEVPAQLLTGYPALQALISNLSSKLSATRTELIDHQSCEMVDAELVNQGLVLEAPPAWLSQLFAQEIALLRWRARRMNAEPAALNFGVDIRQYVAVSALEVASLQQERRGLSSDPTEARRLDRRVLSWSTILDDERDAERQLRYFEALASLFEPMLTTDPDPVRRGMRLVIRMIVQSGEILNRENVVILPTSHSQFLAEIR